jgi:hypothetical protein
MDARMTHDELGSKERATLLVLMARATAVANPDLDSNLRIVGEVRRVLTDRGLVEGWREGQAYVHQLTQKGWEWCDEELSAERPPRAGSFGASLYEILHSLRRHLGTTDSVLGDLFQPEKPVDAPILDEEGPDLPTKIRTAYWELASAPNEWVSLARLRPLLSDVPDSELDEALRSIERTSGVTLVPEVNQKALTAADKKASIRIGGKDKHLIAIQGR